MKGHMFMKATVLSDNIPAENLGCEWGLSIFIEYHGKLILLDAGASGLFLKNADVLGLNMKDVDFGVLSHAHYDHADGIPEFFRVNSFAPFYFRETTGENCCKGVWNYKKYIGIPKGMLKKYPDRIKLVSGDFSPCDRVYLIPHKTPGAGEKRNPGAHVPEGKTALETGFLLPRTESCLRHTGRSCDLQQLFPRRRRYHYP